MGQRPKVFFDISCQKQKLGRIIIELFSDLTPNAAQIFRKFCTGEHIKNNKPIGYKQTIIHKVSPQVAIEGGDFFLEPFPFKLLESQLENNLHNEPGLLSLVPNQNKEIKFIFQISGMACPQLNGKYPVIGKVADDASLKIVRLISNVAINNEGKPKNPLIIHQCGQM